MKITTFVTTARHWFSRSACSVLALGILGFVIPTQGQSLSFESVNFDNLADMAAVPNGYAGLNWSNFVAISDSDPAFYSDGFYYAMASAPNVVFNPYGNNASISSSNAFNLGGAYFAAVGEPTEQLEVQGYNGTNLLYDQTFTLTGVSSGANTNGDGTNSLPPYAGPGPENLITFYYNGVTQVDFIAGTQFAMGSLSVDVLVPTNGSETPIDLGQVEVTSIGHTFINNAQDGGTTDGTNNPPPNPPPPSNPVSDYLVDQSQTSGGGATLPSVTADFDTNDNFEFTVSAPPGKQFLVQPPAGIQPTMVVSVDWQASEKLTNDFFVGGLVSVSFGGLNGIDPGYDADYAELTQLHSFFGINGLPITFFATNISFTSVTLTGSVPFTDMASGLSAASYTPLTNASIIFYYETSQTNDPGRFVSLVPINSSLVTPRPTLSIGMGQNGDLTLTFVGTLQSANRVSGPYSDVPGNPQGTFTIPQASLGTQAFFRSRSGK